jgi:hypothetical protein
VIHLGEALCIERLAHAPGEIGERLDILQRYPPAQRIDQEEPVASPGDIAAHRPDTLHLDDDSGSLAVARHVGNVDSTIVMQLGIDRTYGSVDPQPAWREPPGVRE